MHEIMCDVAVIGGGPAGLAAAVAARRKGAEKVLVVERDSSLGGILQQCIHPGFGLSYYQEELTGPEYAGRFIGAAQGAGVEFLLNSMVLETGRDRGVFCVNREHGVTRIAAKSVALAMGCRERTRGAIQIPGSRPAGVYTAGAAQRLINRQNEMAGRKMLILGSGDIGMIMARRMTLEGAEVVAVVEIMAYLAGLTRNRVQCLDDFGIPLLLSHTVTRIAGRRRVEGVYVAPVDGERRPLTAQEKFFPCDTLLLSVGLIPENELSRAAGIEIHPMTGGPAVDQHMQTSVPGIFASGNVVHVNDLVDNVSVESEIAGRSAALFAAGRLPKTDRIVRVSAGENVRYVCPQRLELSGEGGESAPLYFRVSNPAGRSIIQVLDGGAVVATKKAVRVNPGEMERIAVDAGALRGDEIVVGVIPDN